MTTTSSTLPADHKFPYWAMAADDRDANSAPTRTWFGNCEPADALD